MGRFFNRSSLAVFAGSIALLGGVAIARANLVPNANINFAGAGGDFNNRTVTMQVPESSTVETLDNGLRLYDAHIARMIEVTEYWCHETDRAANYTIFWNYEADSGKIFMGEYPITCQFADSTFTTFGSSQTEKITIHHRGNPTTVTIPTLDLNGSTAEHFINLSLSIEPQCIEVGRDRICPGHKWE
jgi:hypothetical protein